MSNIVVVGCGNIGSRLLQSISNVATAGPLCVYGVEPNDAAWELSFARFNEENVGGHQLMRAERIEDIPPQTAVLVLSMDARNRFAALREALSVTAPKAVFFEKVLFTRKEHYKAASDLIIEAGAAAYVNCTRNVWPGYRDLKAQLSGAGPVARFDVEGGDWNLGSNAIHFLAAFEFLAGDHVAEAALGEIASLRAAKRTGYREIVGELSAASRKGAQITLSSSGEADRATTVRIEAGSDVFVVDEKKWTLCVNGCEERAFGMLHASQLHDAFSALIKDGSCGLPTYEESARLHLVLLEALEPALEENGQIPVT